MRENLGVQQSNDSDDEDLYMYLTNMPPDELNNYRETLWASKKSNGKGSNNCILERVRVKGVQGVLCLVMFHNV